VIRSLSMRWQIAALLSSYLIALPRGGVADTTTGKVIGVSDGDTITYLFNDSLPAARRRPKKVRLYGIDCPEMGQPFGKAAKQLTAELVFGKTVEVRPVAIDRYRRVVARVSVEGQSLSEHLLRAGLAWWYRKYAAKNRTFARLAAEAARGLAPGQAGV